MSGIQIGGREKEVDRQERERIQKSNTRHKGDHLDWEKGKGVDEAELRRTITDMGDESVQVRRERSQERKGDSLRLG